MQYMPPHIPLPEAPSYDYPSIYAKVFLVDSFLQFEKPCMHLSFPLNVQLPTPVPYKAH
jgi:hypothetical protein